MAEFIYLCLLLPWYDNPLGLRVPSKPTRTLILDWEQEKPIVEWYMRRLRLGHDLGPFDLFHLHCDRPLADDLQKIQGEINRVQADCVIVDSLGAACGGDLFKPEPVLKYFSSLRQLKGHKGDTITSLNIGQTSKNETGNRSIFGSTFFTYYARSILEVCRSQESCGDEISVALFHRWFNYGKLQPPVGFTINYREDQGIEFNHKPIDMSEFIDKVKDSDKIINVLSHGAKTPKEIMDETGVSKENLYVVLNRLDKRGVTIKLADGRRGLVKNT